MEHPPILVTSSAQDYATLLNPKSYMQSPLLRVRRARFPRECLSLFVTSPINLSGK